MNYKKIYDLLIERAKGRTPVMGSFYERNHIIPKCLGGTNDPINLANLTPEEHFVAHQLLVKIYPDNYRLIFAVNRMSNKGNGVFTRNNKMYGWLKRRFALATSKLHKNKPKSEEHKRKIGIANAGRKQTEEHIQNRLKSLRETLDSPTYIKPKKNHEIVEQIEKEESLEEKLFKIREHFAERKRQKEKEENMFITAYLYTM